MSRKIKAIVFALLPFVLIEVIQVAASIFMSQIAVGLYVYHFHGITMQEFLDGLKGQDVVNVILYGTYLIYEVVALIVFGVYYYQHFYKKSSKKYNRNGFIDMRFPEPNVSFRGYNPVKFVVGVILFAVGMLIVVQYMMSALAVLFPMWLAELMQLEEAAGLTDMTPLTLIYVCIIGPMVEELGFRGLSTEYLRRGFGFWGTCIIQAIIFGVMHMNPMQACYAFVIGLGLGYVYLKTGNIIVTMVLHMVYNSTTTGLSYIPWDNASTEAAEVATTGTMAPVMSFFILLAGIVATYVGIKLLVKMKKRVNISAS